ncbi:MAG: SIS domain-containing protein [Bryobacteraceae bacterium]
MSHGAEGELLPVAILAGGLATRLRPVTEKVPKSLVPVAGEPFLAHQLRLLRRAGIRRAVLCTGHLGEMIEEYAGNGSRFGVELTYSPDGPTLVGTGGAVRQALPQLGERFFVLYGDSYLPCDYAGAQRVFLESGLQGLMTVYRNEGQWDTSNVEYQDGRIVAYDKRNRTPQMRYIDYGLGLFHRSAFDDTEEGAFDLAGLFQRLLARNELAAYEVGERFYEIGSFQGMEELSTLLSGTTQNKNEEGSARVSFIEQYINESKQILDALDRDAIAKMVAILGQTRSEGGRLFILGVGGSAANASHAVNDFRKIVGIEAYAPTDNVSELTARTNDEGWPTVFESWLKTSRINKKDTVLVFSVGGGNLEKNVSPNLVSALQAAKKAEARVLGIVGRDGGYTAQVADACVIVPTVNAMNTTPHAEAFQGVVWHLLVSHPDLKQEQTKWESVR